MELGLDITSGAQSKKSIEKYIGQSIEHIRHSLLRASYFSSGAFQPDYSRTPISLASDLPSQSEDFYILSELLHRNRTLEYIYQNDSDEIENLRLKFPNRVKKTTETNIFKYAKSADLFIAFHDYEVNLLLTKDKVVFYGVEPYSGNFTISESQQQNLALAKKGLFSKRFLSALAPNLNVMEVDDPLEFFLCCLENFFTRDKIYDLYNSKATGSELFLTMFSLMVENPYFLKHTRELTFLGSSWAEANLPSNDGSIKKVDVKAAFIHALL